MNTTRGVFLISNRLVIVAVPLAAASVGLAADLSVDPARVAAIAPLLPRQAAGVGRPIGDRAAWTAVAARPHLREVRPRAEELLKEPLQPTDDDLYLDYSRTGVRTRWEELNFRRRERITTLALAECLEDRGRFLPALAEVIESVCAEKTWLMPAHDVGLVNYRGERITIDLGSSNLAWVLATADWLLGDRLDHRLREMIRQKAHERIFEPFKRMLDGRQRPDNWIRVTGNHNSVTLAGVTGAALALLEPAGERAFFVAAAEQHSRNFLKGFAGDGYCTEGVGYWNYGFGHYLMLAETIAQATGGRIDLLAGDDVRRPALYGSRIEIMNGVYPSFSDCDVDSRADRHLLWYVSRRWGLGQREFEVGDPQVPTQSLFETVIFTFPNAASRTRPAPKAWTGLGPRSWFDQAGVLIARPAPRRSCRLAVALKGGHNAEHHNHNDVGSYVAVVGRVPILTDPGAEVYTSRTFSTRRYESKATNSYGHPVPVPGGVLQRPGADARGRVVRTDFTDAADTLVLDLRSAYDLPELDKLERTFVYSRAESGSLTVIDDVAFKAPRSFGTALVTFGTCERTGPDRLRIEEAGEALEVAIRAAGDGIDVKFEELQEDFTARRTPMRVGIDFAGPVKAGRITVVVTPAPRQGG
ncbi:MAG: heparinase II/III family protein [Phycisphaerae bacterium]